MTVDVWNMTWAEAGELPERCLSTLQQRVAELERLLGDSDAQLTAERERSSRAKRKIKQLLAKVQERDAEISDLRAALERLAAAGSRAGTYNSPAAGSASARSPVSPIRAGAGGSARGGEFGTPPAPVALARSPSASRAGALPPTAPPAPAPAPAATPAAVAEAFGLADAGGDEKKRSAAGSSSGTRSTSARGAGERRSVSDLFGDAPAASSASAAPAPASQQRSGNSGAKSRASRERELILEQLGRHLDQMRNNVAEGERELSELLQKKKLKEAEWTVRREVATAAETQVHWQTLGLLGQQIAEKQAFNQELTQKWRTLEKQVRQQRSQVPEASPSSRASAAVPSASRAGKPGASAAAGAAAAGAAAPPRPPGAPATAAAAESPLRLPVARARGGGGGGEASSVSPPLSPTSEAQREDAGEALQAFVEAAGAGAEVLFARPALRACFARRPPQLGAAAVEGLEPEDRARAISLFAAWSAVTSEPPHALRISDVHLQLQDLHELKSTLETCSAQLEEAEVTRCPLNEKRGGAASTLLAGLASQPLRRLSLGYDALGPAGAVALVSAAPTWSATLEHLCLEMNGLGDSGCHELAQGIARGLLPALCSLELGWNELSAACAPALAALLDASPLHSSAGALRKLGLSGNKLGSQGGDAMIRAALSQPAQRPIELDLSMNHIGTPPLWSIAEWAESPSSSGLSVAVSICLEWNVIDDTAAVRRVSQALRVAGISSDAGVPLLRLANNDDLVGLSSEELATDSRGLVVS